jgi:uncharacterized OB-fold protein
MPADRHITNVSVPFTFEYKYRIGEPLDKFIDGLAAGKFVGTKCPQCGKVLVPPRTVCGSCFIGLNQYVELSATGTLTNFTIGRVKIAEGEVVQVPDPYVIGQIKLDGADSLIEGLVKKVDPRDVKVGMRLKAVFASEPKGSWKDYPHFEPIG